MLVIRAFISKKLKNITEYRAKEIINIDENDEDELQCIRDGGIPMLCFKMEDGCSICIPIQYVISIKEEN